MLTLYDKKGEVEFLIPSVLPISAIQQHDTFLAHNTGAFIPLFGNEGEGRFID